MAEGGSEIEVRPSSNVAAEVNGAKLVTMYLDGIPIQVPENRMGELQARGALAYGPEDMGRLATELDTYIDQYRESYHRFVDGVLADGEIDVADGAEGVTMQRALSMITGRSNELIQVAYQNFPVGEQRESAADRRKRMATDMMLNGWSPEELQRRYGINDDERAAVVDAADKLNWVPRTEPMAQLEGRDTLVPLSEVKGADKERIVAVTTAPSQEG